MAVKAVETGTLGNLTPQEEKKLQEAWIHTLRLCGIEPDAESDQAKAFAGVPDKTALFHEQLSKQTRDNFTQCFWSFAGVEHPDSVLLRFLRARKWDVDKSVAMMVSAINWRSERRIDETVLRKGESVALQESMTADEQGFINQYRSGKSFVRGVDKDNRPIYIIRVRLHDPNMQSGESMESYVLHSIESMRALVHPPRDTACLVFDMTGFGLKNMDFHVVRFLITVFEARYPETLGVVLVHNAPFVFWGLWRIIKGWLDPVIAAKTNFTRSNADMQRFVAKDNLQTCYGGQDEWEFDYPEPVPGENALLDNADEKAKIEADGDELRRQYEKLTLDWASTDKASAGKAEERSKVAEKLAENYWALDPYVRAKNYYKRVGVVDEKGSVDFKGAGRDELSN